MSARFEVVQQGNFASHTCQKLPALQLLKLQAALCIFWPHCLGFLTLRSVDKNWAEQGSSLTVQLFILRVKITSDCAFSEDEHYTGKKVVTVKKKNLMGIARQGNRLLKDSEKDFLKKEKLIH